MPRKSRRLENYKIKSVYGIMPNDLNSQATIFGGRISSEVDKLSGSVAKKYSVSDVVTASLFVPFYNPAYKGEDLTFDGRLIYVGGSSMVVLVKVTSEDYKTGERSKVATCYTVFVAKDECENLIDLPKPVVTKKMRKLYNFGKSLKENSIELSERLYDV